MEIELEPRVRPLSYKIKAMSRESSSQKASNVLDADLRSHWSTGTNTKEWVLLELDEPCLLSHIRIHNKSVLEWEIAAGLRYKPETFVKVRSRCEAPRRDIIYSTNYTPCRYVRFSCLRGNPIAIFFIQLIGVHVSGLEPEFQSIVNFLLPHILSHKQDAHDIHLELLQDITSRLLVFLPQLEGDLARFADAAESNMRFFAMLAGPFYPILHIVKERETARSAANAFDFEAFKSNQLSSTLSVSSNFEPRRSRGTPLLVLPASNTTIFRPDTIFSLLRKAYKDPKLRTVCIMVCKILHNLVEPGNVGGAVSHNELASSIMNEAQAPTLVPLVDYSSLFGEEFQMPNDQWDSSYLNILDIGAVEEGVLHVVFACASEPFMCSKLADNILNLWSSLPLVQALLPVLRPSFGSFDEIDDSFSHWKQPFVQQALSQIVATSSSSLYRPLLHVCAGYLSSFSPSHAKAACLLIDLCFGALAPWLVKVIAKVDLTMELLEDFLGIIQGACQCFPRARAALTYIVLALTGHMDDILTKYKEVKHRILFLLEMLEPFLDLAIISEDKIISTGDMPYVCVENEESTCAIALKIIRTAVHKSDVLPSLETEWRRGSVAPSVLLSILEPHMQLPPDIDICKSAVSNNPEPVLSNATCHSSVRHLTGALGHNNQDDSDGKIEASEASMKMDISEDASLFFAPPELKSISLVKVSEGSDKSFSDSNPRNVRIENNHSTDKNFKNQFQDALILDANLSVDYFNTHADYLQLTNLGDCELRASEFRQLAADLHSQKDISPEGHDAAIDSLLLAAECYVNPFFMMSYKAGKKLMDQANIKGIGAPQIYEISKLRRISNKNGSELEKITQLELKRDKVVLQILLEAAELDWNYQNKVSDSDNCLCYPESCDEPVTTVSPFDIKSADSVTLLRQNQTLLGSFLIHRLHKTQQSMHEVLLQSFLFLLQSATKLFCAPESIIDIILGSAEHLNRMVTSYYFQFKGGMQFDPEKVHELRRRWILLQNLVNASTHGDESSGLVSVKKCFLSSNLIPPWAWIQRIPTFSLSPYPVVRFLGWMAVSRNAQGYLTARLLLAADLSQLSYLLSVFSDDLLLLNNVANRKNVDANTEKTREGENAQIHSDKSFGVVYPDLRKFFPNMKEQLEGFGEIILEAVALQLKSLSSSVVPDLLCWFSDLCSSPFLRKYQIYAGNGVRNARAIILYTLDAIVTQHMEAMVPEVPRVVQVLVSLCKSSYCDVSFLDSILRLVKPIILYSLHKILDGERLFDNSFLDFESLCFNGLFQDIMNKNENQDSSAETAYFKALPIFILASVFPKLSFQRKRQFLQSLVVWTNFASFEPTACFLDYLSAFQRAVESCKTLSVQTLRVHCAIPLQVSHFSDGTSSERLDSSEQHLCFLDDLFHSSCLYDVSSNLERGNLDAENLNQLADHLADEEIVYFCEDLEGLIFKLCPTIELCWKLHPQLAKKLALALGECFFYLRCLLSVSKNESAAKKHDAENLSLPLSVDWEAGLEGLAKLILTLQDNRCWEVASLELDCLLGTPKCFCANNSLEYICSAIKIFSNCAPKLSWRLQTDKWLLILFGRGIMSFNGSINSLIDLLNAMLCHSEPEQRIIALQHLGRFVAQDGNWEISSTYNNKLVSPALYSPVSESILSRLVSDTWNPVVVLASTDSSLPLRMRALTLLLEYIPFADCRKLKSFLEAVDFVLPCLGRLAQSTYEGPFLEHSLALIASAVLYSPSEDISLIPENVWRNIEALGTKRCEGKLGDMENLCRALCKLRQEGDDAKKGVKEVLTSGCSKEFDPDFQSTRESILQVLANLTSVRSYFDMFSNKIDEEAMELEEAEMELDILQKENVCLEPSADTKQGHSFPQFFDHMEEGSRLKQIKDCICSIERAKIREEIAACRQKKLLARQARREFLEKAALQEAELLQELDRKRTAEVEREIGRQHLLELERAKSRELRYNLEIEKEKQMQRELQRELEQAESGVRLSRREFSSIHGSHSRPRERYRERENGRTGSEGSTRTGTGNLQLENPAPTVILSGSRSFSGHPPSILQSRERSDECGSSYEESMDGSKDFSDMGNVGDPELMSAMDGQPGNYGSSQRHGSRGSKSRQAVERREREGGRREGKWERKQS